MPDQLPGANVLAVMMQAPTDIMGLATRQITEAVDTVGAGIQRFSAELAVPPEISGMPVLPLLPGMAPAGAPPVGATQAAPTVTSTQARALTRTTQRSRIIV
jgi:hypothetical protein